MGGFLAALLLLLHFQRDNYIEQPLSLDEAVRGAALSALVGAVAESFDFGPWDNLPIVAAAGVTAHVALHR